MGSPSATPAQATRGEPAHLGTSMVFWAFGLALAVLAVVGLATYRYFARYGESEQWVAHTHEVLTKVEEARVQIADAETGLRGYLLTEDDRSLQSYQSAATMIPLKLDDLARLTADNPRQHARLAQLGPAIRRRLEEMAVELRAFRDGGRAAAIARIRAYETAPGDARTRELFDEIRQEEEGLLTQRLLKAQDTSWRVSLLIAFGNSTAFLVVVLAAVGLSRQVARHRTVEARLQTLEERRLLLEQVGTEQRRTHRILEELPTAIFLLEAPSGKVLYVNRAAETLFGRPIPVDEEAAWTRFEVEDLDGRRLPPEEFAVARAVAEERVVTSPPERFRRPDGSHVVFVAHAAPLRDGGGAVDRVLVSFDDVTEVQRAGDRRREEMELRDLFLGIVGHDLRNPLSVISTGAQSLVRKGDLRPEQEKVLERMRSSSQRMSRMIDELLDLTRSRLGGGIAIHKQRADLAEVVAHVVEESELAHPERTIMLSSSGSLLGAWDADRFAQVVTNLVTNALQHGDKAGPVTVRLVDEGKDVLLEVHNEGPPIPDELQAILFDPFRRGSTDRHREGLGLGLYIAQQIVQRHGGTIDVRSATGEGTTFRVRMPRE